MLWLLGMNIVVYGELLVMVCFRRLVSFCGVFSLGRYFVQMFFIVLFLLGIVYIFSFIGLLESVVILNLKLVLFRWYIGRSIFIGWLLVENMLLFCIRMQCLLVLIISIFLLFLYGVGQLVLLKLVFVEVYWFREQGEGKNVLCLVWLGVGVLLVLCLLFMVCFFLCDGGCIKMIGGVVGW